MKKALLIIDYQNDFVDPHGSLYVPESETLLPYLQHLIKIFKNEGNIVIASKDWHPEDHISFQTWPVHCLQNSYGAEFYKLDETLIDYVIYKGAAKDADSYGAFFDDKHRSNGLNEYLLAHQITDLTIVGVAGDYCVQKTQQQAVALGYTAVRDEKGIKSLKDNS